MEYRSYTIKRDGNHYKVIAPDGTEWHEDTARDAEDAIDEEIES